MGDHSDTVRVAAGPASIGVCAVTGLAGLIRASRPILHGPDPFWHWDVGRRIVSTGALPRTDPYSFLTSGETWVLNQWGTELVIGITDRVGGLWLLAVVTALVVAAGVGLTGREMWRRAPSLLVVGMLGLIMLTGMSSWVLRGTLATLVLLPLLLRELLRQEPRIWVLGVLFLLWANLHAAFVLGIALVVVAQFGRLLVVWPGGRRPVAKRSAFLLLAAILPAFVNPYGPRYVWDVVRLAVRGPATGISEWAPPEILELRFLPFTVLAAVVLVGMALAARRRDLPEVLLAVAAIFFGLTAQRNVTPAALVVGIVGAPYVLAAWRIIRERPQPDPAAPVRVTTLDRIAGGLALALCVAITVVVVPRSNAVAAHTTEIPLALIHELDALDREARVAATALWTPAISTLTGDHVSTEVDGRAELFSREDGNRHRNLHNGVIGWQDTLDDWCVTDVLVPLDAPLARTVASTSDWLEVRRTRLHGSPRETVVWFERELSCS